MMSKTSSGYESLGSGLEKRRCLMRMKDASEAPVPCHSVAGLFEPTLPYCFFPANCQKGKNHELSRIVIKGNSQIKK